MDLFLIDPEELPFEERMKGEEGWPDEVSIANLSKACYPDDEEKRKRLLTKLIGFCRSGDIAYRGDIKGWRWGRTLYGDDSFTPVGTSKNPHDGTKGVPISSGDSWQDAVSSGDKWWADPSECLIHKDEFKRYLQSVSQQPDIGFLVNWWGASGQQAETVGNYGTGGQAAHGQSSAKVIQPNRNECAFSGLLNIPGRVDDWFEVIDIMTENFFTEHETLPTKAKAWTCLWTTPPDKYGITAHEDRSDPYLKMPSTKTPLKRSNFFDRWAGYIEKKTE